MNKLNITEEEFKEKYETFRKSLPFLHSGEYAKLHTRKNSSPFKAYRHKKESSILIKAPKKFNKSSFSLVTLPFLLEMGFHNRKNVTISNKDSFRSIVKYLFKRISNDDLIGKEERKMEKVIKQYNKNSVKNIILYGSPGVGKTHNTNKLIRLIEDGKSDKDIFEEIKKNSEHESIDISDIKERVKFITFHQSFGYEDFIEGFRPNEEGNIELTKGIFREICRDAQQNLDDNKKDIFELKKEYTLQNNLENFINYCISKEEKIYLTKTMYINNIDDKAFYYTSNSKRLKNIKIPLTDLLLCASHKVTNLQDIKDLDNISGTSKQRPTYIYKLYKLYELFEKYIETNTTETKEIKKVELKNYYLVIDEINRGNISKIFGELITLIEEDKRDKLEVTLPYSKQSFKIPSNLYIIGTMNSTDKSIALIDIALRRRFTFLKMKPNVELVPKDSQELFKKLNEHITKTLGEDYQIGHSYFMGGHDLDFVLEYKINPLLEEYFYGDDDGLKEVLKLIENDERS